MAAKRATNGRVYQVNEVATLSGVSVRALHYYDEIGLLSPRSRSRAGYRLYDAEDLLRLQQILIGRELGLSLDEIRRSLDDPGFDKRHALVAQRRQLVERAHRTEAMIRAIDAALASLEAQSRATERREHTAMDTDDTNADDPKALFDGFDPKQYESEAEQRWGNSDAYRESMRRTQSYTADDWKRLSEEQSAIYRDVAALLRAGTPATDPAAMDVAERHRELIDRWFYPCSYAVQRGLADMYENDRRFADNIDKFGAGLTPYIADAIKANAARHGE